MRFAHLVWVNLLRNKRRTILTTVSVAVAFFLFGTLRSVLTTLDAATEVGSEARLVTTSASGITFPLPQAHAQRLLATDGIKSVSWANWFGGYYTDPNDFFAQFAIEAESYLPMYPDIQIPEDQKAAFLKERTAAIAGVGLMEKYGWHVGQTVTLKGTIFPGDWEFTIRGVYTPANPSYGDATLFFHYKYLYEATDGRISPGWYVLELEDPDRAAEIASRIDASFENSSAPTKTETERAWQTGFVTMWGNVSFLVRSIGTAVFFAILLVAANTMMMAVRERVNEVAVMKTLGFQNGTLFGIVLTESVIITLIGGSIGLFAARAAFSGNNTMNQFFPGFGVEWSTIVLGLAIATLLGFVSGAVPALQSARLSVVQAFRRIA
ncbi:MAG: ABC transporter permease [Gemmatimonadales bacterium]